MPLRQRTTLLEKFSSFIKIEENGSVKWTIDPEARRHIQQRVEEETAIPITKSENEWVWEFRLTLRTDPGDRFAKLHLVSYLQEACYRASTKIKGLRGAEAHLTELTQREAFSIVSEVLVKNLLKILKKHNPSKSKLTTWASYQLENLTKESLRVGDEKCKYTKGRLLKMTGQKALEDALESNGVFKVNLLMVSETELCDLLRRIESKSNPVEADLQISQSYKENVENGNIDPSISIQKLCKKKENKKKISSIEKNYNQKTSSISLSEERVRDRLHDLQEIVEQTSQHFQYILVWNIYCKVVVNRGGQEPPKIKRHPWPPTDGELQKIADRYNRQRPYPEIVPELDGDRVQEYLETCADSVRNKDRIMETATDIEQADLESPIQPMDPQDYQEAIGDVAPSALRLFVRSQIEISPTIDRWILKLEVGIGLTQTDVGIIVGLEQYQVSREKQKIKKRLLKDFVTHMQQTLNLTLTTELIGRYLAPLHAQTIEDVLKEEVWEHLKILLQENFQPEVGWLKRWDAILWECGEQEKLAIETISKEFSQSPKDSRQRLKRIEQQLARDLQQVYQGELQKSGFDCDLDGLPASKKAFPKQVTSWLSTVRLNALT